MLTITDTTHMVTITYTGTSGRTLSGCGSDLAGAVQMLGACLAVWAVSTDPLEQQDAVRAELELSQAVREHKSQPTSKVFLSMKTLQSPFPYFGGKRIVAPIVWQALGTPGLYCESVDPVEQQDAARAELEPDQAVREHKSPPTSKVFFCL